MNKDALKYGLFIGSGLSIWSFLEYYTGFHTNEIDIYPYIAMASLIVPVAFLIFGIRAEKSKAPDNFTFVSGMKFGMQASIIAGVVGVIGVVIYFNFVNPGWTEFMAERAELRSVEAGRAPSEIQTDVENVRAYFSQGSYMIQTFVMNFMSGSLISIIVSALLRKR